MLRAAELFRAGRKRYVLDLKLDASPVWPAIRKSIDGVLAFFTDWERSALRDVRSNVRSGGDFRALSDRPVLADTVEKVEISVSLKFR